MDLKIVSSIRKKNKIVKKLKAHLGVDDEEDDEEDAKEQGPLAITQGLGEDTKEGAEKEKDEEAKQAPLVEKKRKAKARPKPRQQKKIMKPSPFKPSTRIGASTRASMQKAKEQAKERASKAK